VSSGEHERQRLRTATRPEAAGATPPAAPLCARWCLGAFTCRRGELGGSRCGEGCV